MSLLPKESLDQLRCSLCLNYLSVPPITTICSHGKQHKCGRCSHINTPINNQDDIYEAIAKIGLFPCTYPNCEEILSWGQAAGHETNCPYRIMKCPVSWKCSDIVNVLELVEHCTKQHHSNVKENVLITPVNIIAEGKKKFTIVLLLKDGLPFLVYTVVTIQNVWINVFSLHPQENAKYQLELISSSSNSCCLSFRNAIVPFDSRLNCKECVLKECTNKLHQKAEDENNEKLDDFLQRSGFQKIKRELLAELNLKELRYTVLLE
ncbi:unnamed protein product [Phaedon cochleariae]|uniref:Uncharacterized protein n=1 Tax=Phaedon cochleariae TaxID=80249 RepID=A0A9N9SHH9_PHACE|nr:unnamed protein product [Phaedon cochleariae]